MGNGWPGRFSFSPIQSPSCADVRTEALGLKKGVKFSNYEMSVGATGIITKTLLIHKHLEFAYC